jgi:hypothetical protein
MKVKDLTGAVLDYWTARAESKIKPVLKRNANGTDECLVMSPAEGFIVYSPSSDPTISGDIADLRGVITNKFGAEVPDEIVRV